MADFSCHAQSQKLLSSSKCRVRIAGGGAFSPCLATDATKCPRPWKGRVWIGTTHRGMVRVLHIPLSAGYHPSQSMLGDRYGLWKSLLPFPGADTSQSLRVGDRDHVWQGSLPMLSDGYPQLPFTGR